MFRWDKWAQGAIGSGFVAAVATAPMIVMNGITKQEAWAIFSIFLGGIALFCKEHKPADHHDTQFWEETKTTTVTTETTEKKS